MAPNRSVGKRSGHIYRFASSGSLKRSNQTRLLFVMGPEEKGREVFDLGCALWKRTPKLASVLNPELLGGESMARNSLRASLGA